MTIHLTGYEALTEAYYANRNVEVLLHARFTIDVDGRKIPVDPFQALEKVDRWELSPEKLSCEVCSVWDFLMCGGEGGDLFHVHIAPRTALVLTREYGDRLAEGIRAVAVAGAVFERAVSWAVKVPLTDPGHDLYAFLGRLEPRMPLGIREWAQNGDLRRCAREIGMSLVDLFGLDPESVGATLRARHVLDYECEDRSYGGDLLDIVLEILRKGGSLSERTGRGGGDTSHSPFAWAL